jgi:hypothetical protein
LIGAQDDWKKLKSGALHQELYTLRRVLKV